MDARHTISEAAARTGFTSSALRYYERAGLISPERTKSGYRVYDARSVERLRFIARAKQLGLRLDEITELVQLWDGDQCAPVAGRLRDLVDEKIGETEGRLAELAAFAAELRRFRTSLAIAEPASGPCGDGCACHPQADASAGVALLRTTDVVPDSPAIACTLAPAAMANRMAEWQQLLARSNGAPTAIDGGFAVRFPVDATLAARVAALAAAEQSCCDFFTFSIRIERTATTLTVTAPADAAPLVDALFGVPG